MQVFVAKCRDWQKKNRDYELCCDVPDASIHYVQWSELPKAERMSWVGSFGRCAKDAFEEFGTKRCKVEVSVLDCNMNLLDVMSWPPGNAMMVFRTKQDGASVI